MLDESIASADYQNKTCPAVECQKIGISIPVTVTYFPHTKSTITYCRGDPIVTNDEKSSCDGLKSDSRTFKLCQTICITVPVYFGVNTGANNTYVNFISESTKDICTNYEEESGQYV